MVLKMRCRIARIYLRNRGRIAQIEKPPARSKPGVVSHSDSSALCASTASTQMAANRISRAVISSSPDGQLNSFVAAANALSEIGRAHV